MDYIIKEYLELFRQQLITLNIELDNFISVYIVGPQGNIGNRGVQGIRGPNGHDGDRGNVGPQGEQGPRGPIIWE